MWQLQLCQLPRQLSQRRYEGGCWNARAPGSSTVHATLSTAAYLRYNSQACINWEKSWTSLMICTSAALITARMLNYAVRALLKWSLQDKQAILANMTPQRGKNFHRGLSNHVYLVCMNCSGVWNDVTVTVTPNLCWNDEIGCVSV